VYAVSKLYADLVADDGTVAICYLGRLSLGPFRRDYAALELYGPAGDRAVLHAPAPAGRRRAAAWTSSSRRRAAEPASSTDR
jgi:hypothetical protein